MMISKRNRPDRRGAAALEAAVVYPVAMLLLIGTVVVGIAVFRYEQLQALAREGARYASVHGPTYASEQNSSYATSSTVLTYVETMTAGIQPNSLSCTVTWAPNPPTTSTPSTVTVQLSYSWSPEGFLPPQAVSMTASSTMPVTY
jgi:Flp pilus assembly protein TadG